MDAQILELIGRFDQSRATQKLRAGLPRELSDRVRVLLDTEQATDQLANHFQSLKSWAEDVGVSGLIRSKKLRQVFVDLDLDLATAPAPWEDPGARTHKVSDLLSTEGNVAILGQIGAGKSTSMKKLALASLDSLSAEGPLPLFLEFRTLNQTTSLLAHLMGLLGLSVVVRRSSQVRQDKVTGELVQTEEEVEVTNTERNALLARFLDDVHAHVFLDGFDERPAAIADKIDLDLERLMSACSVARFFIAGRTAGFRRSLPRTSYYHLLPLTPDQVRELAANWLGNERADCFLVELKRVPWEGTTVRPLLLVTFCLVFDKRDRIPELPRTAYRFLIDMFTEDWDDYRGVKRASEFSNFEADQKREFLEGIAYHLTKAGARGRFSHEDLEDAYAAVAPAFELPPGAAGRVAREIESHVGLMQRRGPDTFQFFHKSIQEFLTGEFIRGAGVIHWNDWSIYVFPEELAVATALARRPSAFLEEVVRESVMRAWPVDSEGDRLAVRLFIDRLAEERPNWEEQGSLVVAFLLLAEADDRGLTSAWQLLLGRDTVGAAVRDTLSNSTSYPAGDHVEVQLDLGKAGFTVVSQVHPCRVPNNLYYFAIGEEGQDL
jgi:hypothetical protein